MTELVCKWCGQTFEHDAQGRPPKYCRRSHRQRAYEARRARAPIDTSKDPARLTERLNQDLLVVSQARFLARPTLEGLQALASILGELHEIRSILIDHAVGAERQPMSAVAKALGVTEAQAAKM